MVRFVHWMCLRMNNKPKKTAQQTVRRKILIRTRLQTPTAQLRAKQPGTIKQRLQCPKLPHRLSQPPQLRRRPQQDRRGHQQAKAALANQRTNNEVAKQKVGSDDGQAPKNRQLGLVVRRLIQAMHH